MYEICPKLTIKTRLNRCMHFSGVSIVELEKVATSWDQLLCSVCVTNRCENVSMVREVVKMAVVIIELYFM